MISYLLATIAFFAPPQEWEIAQLQNPSPYLQVAFFGKSLHGFRPSINYAVEEVDVSLKEYLKSVKEIQMADPNSKWRDLGRFAMKGGTGRLTEMASPSAWGEIKILQAILVKNKKAHILTTAILKEDFPKHQKELLQTLQSLQFADTSWEPIVNQEKKEKIESLLLGVIDEAKWKELQQEAQVVAQELGNHWQFLVLKEGRSKMYTVSSDKE